MGATENIKEGNEDIREVMSPGCVLNPFLFVLPRCSFTQHMFTIITLLVLLTRTGTAIQVGRNPLGLTCFLNLKVTWHAFNGLWSLFLKNKSIKKRRRNCRLRLKDSAEIVETGVKCWTLAEKSPYYAEHISRAPRTWIYPTVLLIRVKCCFLSGTEISIKTEFLN